MIRIYYKNYLFIITFVYTCLLLLLCIYHKTSGYGLPTTRNLYYEGTYPLTWNELCEYMPYIITDETPVFTIIFLFVFRSLYYKDDNANSNFVSYEAQTFFEGNKIYLIFILISALKPFTFFNVLVSLAVVLYLKVVLHMDMVINEKSR